MIGNVVEVLADKLDLFIAVVLFAFIRYVIAPLQRTIGSFLTNLLVSIPSGVLTGMTLQEMGFGEWLSITLACVVTVIAHDVLKYTVGDEEVIKKIIDKLISKIK